MKQLVVIAFGYASVAMIFQIAISAVTKNIDIIDAYNEHNYDSQEVVQ